MLGKDECLVSVVCKVPWWPISMRSMSPMIKTLPPSLQLANPKSHTQGSCEKGSWKRNVWNFLMIFSEWRINDFLMHLSFFSVCLSFPTLIVRCAELCQLCQISSPKHLLPAPPPLNPILCWALQNTFTSSFAPLHPPSHPSLWDHFYFSPF